MEINVVKLKEYGQSCSVLYVEDDEIIREQTKDFLSRFFTDITTAVDGKEGLEKYLERDFDIVISDINMPNMNGIEMIRAIKERQDKQIVLVTSAHNDSQYLIELINLEVMRFVLKPFNNKQFLIMLYKIVEELHQTTKIKNLQDQMVSLSKKSQMIIDHIDIGIVLLTNNVISMANRAFLNFGGFDSLETLQLELPEIGVLFEEASGCISAESNASLIEQLNTLDPTQHRVKILQDNKSKEYQINATKLEEDESYILSFSDITTIHNALTQDKNTKLPNKHSTFEQIELLKQKNTHIDIILIKLKNFSNINQWYGKDDSVRIEVGFSHNIESIQKLKMPNAFLGHIAENKFILLPYDEPAESLVETLKELHINVENINEKHIDSDVDFNLPTAVRLMKLDTSASINQLEVEIFNEFEIF